MMMTTTTAVGGKTAKTLLEVSARSFFIKPTKHFK